jgi:two-component system chemotaxis sensor kinase CheA
VDQNRRLLLAELEDKIEQIFSAIEQLREVVDDGKETRRLLDEIFRVVHSLKATASSNAHENISQISHQFENLLHSLRTGKTRLDAKVLQVFDETANTLYAALQPNFNSEVLPPFFSKIDQLIESAGKRRRLEVELVLNALPLEVWQSLGDAEKHRLEESVGEGASLFLVGTSFDVINFDQQFQELKDRLTEKGEIISTAPKVNTERPDKIDFRIIYASDASSAVLSQALSDVDGVTVNEVAGPTRVAPVSAPADESSGNASDIESGSGRINLIRIHLEQLDKIISSTHRLYRKTIKAIPEDSAADVRASFNELAADLVNLRMVSVARILQRAVRAGRSAALAANKEIDFVVTGHDLQLDKSLVDAVADPLIHLVRNAVDHGIENTELRKQRGKNEKGLIRIDAVSIQGQTRIIVTDDGRGIDPAAVADAATRMGVLERGSVIGVDHSVRLVFLPGLSTAKEVSDTSGRGVGLDVVETAIEEVGGSVRVSSQPAKGSAFEIRLPVTFGLLDVYVVRANGQSYLIDAAHVTSTQPLAGSDVTPDQNKERQLFTLNNLLGRDNSLVNEPNSAVIFCRLATLKADAGVDERLALVVDGIGQRQQVLVRNLGSRGGRWFGVAGAAELDDGSVVLLLDLPRLVVDAVRSRSRN